jgi:hypothetical protein
LIFEKRAFFYGITTPVPSLKEGGEPYLSAAPKVKTAVSFNIPIRAAVPLKFPSFLQGYD